MAEERKTVEAETRRLLPETLPKETLTPVVETQEPVSEKETATSTYIENTQLSRVEAQKRMSLIKAWEESEMSKIENKAHKKKAVIGAWVKIKEATLEAQLKKIEQCLEKKKAEHAEKMKNKMAMIHKEAEERKAMVEAKHAEHLLKVEEIASKCRATGKAPKKLLVLL
ncbi:remorin 1.4-like [Silene latifolia]|uniref:remorin 1.4-like n=1 Tax=Silene latifolia TaxID=37657 RepID=UPI003D7791A8